MGIINNQGVFIAPPSGSGDLTSFREDDDFSTELLDEPIVEASLPDNVGIAFIKSSDSPADFATISLNGDDTSTIFIDNTAGSANLSISGSLNVSGISTFKVASSPTLTTNSTLSFELTSNTNLRVYARGTDGVTRSANITLS